MDDKTLLEYLDLGIPEAFITEATRAKQAADIENQAMFERTPALPPEPFEDLLTHWTSHFTAMQGCEFKEADDTVKTAMLDHVRATEMLIMDKAFFNGQIGMVKNPAMAQALSMMPNFPAVFSVAVPPPPAPPPLPGDEGMAPPPDVSQGDMLNEVPGTPPPPPMVEAPIEPTAPTE